MKTVYFLGAGFSARGGCPVLRDFFDKVRDLAEDPEVQKQPQLQDAYRLVLEAHNDFEAFRNKFQIDLSNIEELFGLLEVQTLANPSGKPSDIRSALKTVVAHTVLHLQSEGTHAIIPGPKKDGRWADPRRTELYQAFVQVILGMVSPTRTSPEPVIVTTNYDTLVESACRKLGVNVHYGLRSSQPPDGALPIYKLHGSVNWWLTSDRSAEVVEVDSSSMTNLLAKGCLPLLLPPITTKTDELILVKQVWTQAYQALQEARHIVFIGYSFPSTDDYLRLFLTSSIGNNRSLRRLILVENNHKRWERYEQMFDEIWLNRYVSIGYGSPGGPQEWDSFDKWLESYARE